MVYSIDSFRSSITQGLSNLNTDRTKAIDSLIVACHIFDCIPLETFTGIPGNKTDFFVDYLSSLLKRLFPELRYAQMACKELDRIVKYEVFHLGIAEFGYFYAILLLFFSLYQRMTYKLFLELTIDAAEAYREKLHPVAVRIRFWAKMHRIFDVGIHNEVYTSPPCTSEAVNLLEQINARGFLDLFMIIGRPGSPRMDLEWGEFDVMACIGTQIPERPEIYPIEFPDRQHSLKNFPLYDKESLNQFVDNCSSFHIDQWDLPSVRPLAIDEISKSIPENCVYLAYRQLDEKLLCFTVERENRINIFVTDTYDHYSADVDVLEEEYAKIAWILRSLGSSGLPVHQGFSKKPPTSQQKVEDMTSTLIKAYNLLFRKALPKTDKARSLHELITGKKSLLVSPGFPIQSLPMGALHDGFSYLIEKKIVAYIPNSTWYALAEQESKSITTALVLADPESNLLGALAEGQVVTEILKESGLDVTIKKQGKVTRQWFLDNGKSFDLIHFAGHGNFQLKKSSYLQLADGPIYFDEILKDTWKASLVFLNACRTGERQVHFLEETLSLASGILACGVRAVIGTLWPIFDDVAHSFANEFYNGLLKQKRTIGEAYQQAMKFVINDFNNPVEWAPFILSGNPHLRLNHGPVRNDTL